MTSIEWLEEKLAISFGNELTPLRGFFVQSKEMHKAEIIKAFDEGQEYEYQYHINNAPKFDSETYYQETFVSKGSDDHISDISKMVEDDVEKLQQDAWDNYEHEEGNLYSTTFRNAFKLGYNKAKETLYTEEQVIEFSERCFNMELDKFLGTPRKILLQEYIQSLKQPK